MRYQTEKGGRKALGRLCCSTCDFPRDFSYVYAHKIRERERERAIDLYNSVRENNDE